MEYTVQEAAPLLGIKEEAVRHLLRSGRLQGQKLFKRWSIHRDDLVEILRDGFPEPVAQKHDRTHRILFSHPEVIVDLLQGFFNEPWVGELDLTTLEKVSEAFVSHRLDARWADMVWTVKWQDWDLHVCLMFEFQSTVEPFMAVRWLPILGSFYQDQIRQMSEKEKPFPELLLAPEEGLESHDPERYRILPLVIPLVIYNGGPTWQAPLTLEQLIRCPPEQASLLPFSLSYRLLDMGRVPEGRLKDLGQNLVAALVRLETSRPGPELLQEAETAARWIPDHLLESFDVWLRATFKGQGLEWTEKNGIFRRNDTMLAEAIGHWKDEVRREGQEEGQKEGQREGRKEGQREGRKEGQRLGMAKTLKNLVRRRFDDLPAWAADRIDRADVDTLERWSYRVLDAAALEDVFQVEENR